MSESFTLTNARVVLTDGVIEGSVHVARGEIAAIDQGKSRVAGALDCEGDFLLPGLVELHTDNLERQLMPRPGVRWPASAALLAHDAQIASAGITTVCDAVCVGFYGDASERLEILGESIQTIEATRADGRLRAEHLLHLRCEVPHPTVLELFEPLSQAKSLKVVSLMDHTPGQRQWHDIARYQRFHEGRDGTAEDQIAETIRRRREEQEHYAGRHRRRLLDLVAGRNLALASHDDTTAEHVEEAAADGITICEFPTTVAAADAARRHGLGIVMGAPNVVLGGSHSGNVSALELADLDLLDALSSDYVPVSLLHAAFRIHDRLGIDLARTIGMVTHKPAALLGLDDRGAIAVGRRADLVRVRKTDDVPGVMAVWRGGTRIA